MTRQQVIEAQRMPSGCCDRFCDNMACDCLANAEPDAGPCLSVQDVDEIEREVAELYRLYNRCSKKDCSYTTDYKEVKELMDRIDKKFPGYYALQLISEVRYLQGEVTRLTRIIDEANTRHIPLARRARR